jgi:hypothetical protein
MVDVSGLSPVGLLASTIMIHKISKPMSTSKNALTALMLLNDQLTNRRRKRRWQRIQRPKNPAHRN